jgi:hypothetical protein
MMEIEMGDVRMTKGRAVKGELLTARSSSRSDSDKSSHSRSSRYSAAVCLFLFDDEVESMQ